jgi:CheY-like chemotaxis protein
MSTNEQLTDVRKLVLILDDDPLIRSLLKEVFSHGGFNVEISSNPLQAIDRLTWESFDLIVTDVEMPGATGWDVLRSVREIHPETPVMIVSGGPVRLDLVNLATPLTRFVAKPFHPKSILSIAGELLFQSSLN